MFRLADALVNPATGLPGLGLGCMELKGGEGGFNFSDKAGMIDAFRKS